LLTGYSSVFEENEAQPTDMVGSQNQKMLANCDTLSTVTSFSVLYGEGNYEAATEALMYRAGSLATITQTIEEQDLINGITSQIPSIRALMQSGQYDDPAILKFVEAITKYSLFCLNISLSE
jgi:hypothetical protein